MTDPDRIAGRDVAADMAALFGPSVRPAPATPPRPLPVRSRRRGRTLALGAAGLAVAVTAGVLAGTSAVGPVVPPHGATAPVRAAAPVAPRVGPAPAVTAAAWPVALPPTVASAAPDAAPSVTDPADPAPVAAPTAVRRSAAPVAPHYTAPPRAAAPARLAATPRLPAAAGPRPVALRDERCLDDRYCAAVRLYEADGDVAAAYAEATQAGVRARLLRDYRGEWLRARRVGRSRPREALRVYGMIAADLHMLATDPGEGERGDERGTWR